MEHLTPDTAGLLGKPTDERIKALAKEKWVGHTQAQAILTYLAHMHHGPLVDPDAMNLLIIGEPGSGKTSVMRHYASAYKPSGNGFPVLSIKLADGPKESALYETILDVLHSSYPPRASAKDKRCQVLRVLKTSNVQMIFIDEIHHMLLGSAMQQRNFLAGLKTLVNELSIPLVCAGVESAHNALCLDEQTGRRFEVARLPVWSMDRDYMRLLASFERILALRKPSNLINQALAFKLLELSRGSIGRLGRILKLAAIHAVKTGVECITLKVLKDMNALPLADDAQFRSHSS
jgi:DNA polymerase III delta prime subunit